MSRVLIVPGIGSSGPEHWQSFWEAAEPSFVRVQMPSWDQPELEGWLGALAAAVDAAGGAPVLVAHSLGCLAVAHHAARSRLVRAALLVAPPDPDGPVFPSAARSFAPVPMAPMPFPTRVVASRNDPYSTLSFAQRCAKAWGSELVDVGRAGHINAESELGAWAAGRELLGDLLR